MSASTLNTEDQTALEMVRSGYALDDPTDERRVLTFTARFNTKDGALEALRAIDSYNAFDGEAVAQALSRTVDKASITVGREGSPVVYIGPFFGSDAERPPIEAALRDVNADEIDFDGRMVRAWWD